MTFGIDGYDGAVREHLSCGVSQVLPMFSVDYVLPFRFKTEVN